MPPKRALKGLIKLDRRGLKGRPTKGTELPIAEILDLFLKEVPVTIIANQYGVSKRAIYKKLDPFKHLKTKADVEVYRKNKSNLLDGVEHLLVQDIADPGKRKRAGLGEVSKALQVVFNANRLEKGESTSNTNIRQEAFVAMVHTINKQREESGVVGIENEQI
jgi:hypothetical protein